MAYMNLWHWGIALFQFALLYLIVRAIPIQLAWNRKFFKNLIWMWLTTIGYSIFIYGYLFYKSGLIKDGKYIQVSLTDAIYFSVTTWTTLGYGDLTAPEEMRLITSIEAMNGYLAMGIFIVLLGTWIDESIKGLDERMAWIRSLTPEQVQKMQNKINPSIKINKKFFQTDYDKEECNEKESE